MKLVKRERKQCFVKGDADKANVTIQYLYPNEIRSIEAEVNSIVFEKQESVQGVTKVGVNPYTLSLRKAEAAITGWHGFFDTMGKPISFKKKHLATVARFTVENADGDQVDFIEWVADELDKLIASVESRGKEAEEN